MLWLGSAWWPKRMSRQCPTCCSSGTPLLLPPWVKAASSGHTRTFRPSFHRMSFPILFHAALFAESVIPIALRLTVFFAQGHVCQAYCPRLAQHAALGRIELRALHLLPTPIKIAMRCFKCEGAAPLGALLLCVLATPHVIFITRDKNIKSKL